MNTNKDISNFISTNKPVGIKTVCVLNNTSINQKTTDLRQCISDTELLSVFASPPVNWKIDCYRVDWTGMPNILDAKVFETNSEYDALNRVTKMIYPEDVENERKKLTPEYNRAGALQRVTMDGNDYVNHIAYNAKGQRLLIAFGNDVMTRYLYDSNTFNLKRQRSEKYLKNDWTYSGNGGVKQDTAYIYDLIGNITDTSEKNVTECGIGGTSSLDRNFSYDPLYRLLSANGRENSPTITPIWDDSYRSTDNSTTTAYTQNYEYDKVGNIQKLQHIGNNNFTRNFNYSNAANNKLNSIDIGTTNYTFSYDECGNQTQENSSRFFEWDAVDRLRAFYVQAGTSEPSQYAQYLYDSSGNRVKKIIRTQGGDYESVSYINGAFEYKTDGTDEQNTLHIMDDQSRIALVRLGDDFGDTTPAIKYNLEDHLGSSCILLETNGALINKEEYYPFGETSFGSYAKKRYKFSGKERDNESGLYYYGARYYMAWACRFVSCDPLTRDFPWQSSYVGFNNNPIIYIDTDGRSADNISPPSTHIDENGKVIAIIDDGDNSVYMHANNADGKTPTEYQIEKRQKKYGNTSANGTKVGETWTPFGFADFGVYESEHKLTPAPGAKIDLSSGWATEKFLGLIEDNPTLIGYGLKAGTNEKYDYKSKVPDGESPAYGSFLFGKIASARDVGNMGAGFIAEKSLVPTIVSDYGFGKYNQTNNSKLKTAWEIFGDIADFFAPDGTGHASERAYESINFSIHKGEDELSRQGINQGKLLLKQIFKK